MKQKITKIYIIECIGREGRPFIWQHNGEELIVSEDQKGLTRYMNGHKIGHIPYKDIKYDRYTLDEPYREEGGNSSGGIISENSNGKN